MGYICHIGVLLCLGQIFADDDNDDNDDEHDADDDNDVKEIIDVTMIEFRTRAELYLTCRSSSLLWKHIFTPRKALLRHLHFPKVMIIFFNHH